MKPPRPDRAAPGRGAAGLRRRQVLQALPAAAVLGAARPAHATTDLALACDSAIGPALRVVADGFEQANGIRVNVFPTAPGLILPQLEREVQNDIIVTQVPTLQAAYAAGLIAADAVRGAWRNQIVIADLRGAAPTRDKPVAAADPSPASDMDGPDIMRRLNVPPDQILGVIDTDTVVALVLAGQARAGLMHMTDFHPHPELQISRVVPFALQAPIVYRAAVTKLARRPQPASFIDYLIGPEATIALAAFGLETPL